MLNKVKLKLKLKYFSNHSLMKTGFPPMKISLLLINTIPVLSQIMLDHVPPDIRLVCKFCNLRMKFICLYLFPSYDTQIFDWTMPATILILKGCAFVVCLNISLSFIQLLWFVQGMSVSYLNSY